MTILGRNNLYADLDAFRGRYVDKQILDEHDATEVIRMVAAVSRGEDEYCGRRFFAETATRLFDGNNLPHLDVRDLLSVTTLKLDEDTDATFELTLTEDTDFWLEHEGHYDITAPPFNLVRLNPYQGQRSKFIARPRLVQIVGEWGFTNATAPVAGITATLADATTTTMTTNKRTGLAVGQTLLIPADAGGTSEQVYIEAQVSGQGTKAKWTVQRGLNGTTAAQATDKAVSVYVYNAQVSEATLIQAGRLWKRRETAFSTMVVNPAVGSIEVFKGLDPDVKAMLDPFRVYGW